ncbi:MAG: family 78 glycoside hydrolase catalytic domain, partial [Propionicimonas sp.]|nr:family 78 glycoside hydrolase catalytic domain [Propionicimonas sp.]
MANALSVDTLEPSVSWVVNDPDENEVQTAFRIVVSTSKANGEEETYLHDTQWVESAQNTGVEIPDIAGVLSEDSLYYWQVQTKDKDGAASPLSEPQSFTTGTAWANTQGVWLESPVIPDDDAEVYLSVPKGTASYLTVADSDALGTGLESETAPTKLAAASLSQWTNYAVEMDLKTSTVAGVVFRDNGTNNFMWQFRASDQKVTPHTGRTYVALTATTVTVPSDTWFRVRIEAQGNQLTTFINGTQVDQRTSTHATSGTIGFRTGSSESFYADNITVQSLDTGKWLYAEDFSAESLGTSSAFSGCTVTDGTTTALSSPYFLFLRHSFELTNTATIEKAVIQATGFNSESVKAYVYDLYVNGEAIGAGPARRNDSTSTGNLQYYNSYDVTDLLQDGENVIAAINYNKDDSRAVLFQLEVWRTDGSKQVVTNSGRDAAEWSAYNGTQTFGNVSQGSSGYYEQHKENLNAAAYPEGFADIGYTESAAWQPATLRSAAINGSRVLVPYPAESATRVEMPAESVQAMDDGSYLITLKKAIVGSLQLSLNSPAASQITVRYGEALNSDGSVKYVGTGHPTYDETWTLKAGQQTLRTTLMKNFRYIQISGSPVAITTDMVTGLADTQQFDSDASSFDSSDAFLNELYEFTKYSVEATNQDLWTDSQARERRAYEGDVIVNWGSSTAVSANYALARHTSEYLVDHETWPAEYKLFSVIVAWDEYLHTQNADSISAFYAKLKNKFPGSYDTTYNLVSTSNSCGNQGGSTPLIDWPTTEQDGLVCLPVSGLAAFNTPYNAIYSAAAQAMANIAGVLGESSDQASWQQRATNIKAALISQMYDASKGAFIDSMATNGTKSTHYAQHATAFALAYGIYDSPEMASALGSYLASTGGFKGSIYASFFVLYGLYAGNSGQSALDFLLNPDSSNVKTFAHVLNTLNATISPEAWDPSRKSNMTYSHPWGSSPGAAIAHGMFGINPTAPGYAEFTVKFQPGEIATASITVPTLRGQISASSDTTGDHFAGTVTVPANTVATVSVPETNPTYGNVLVDGAVVAATRSGGFLTVEVGSGTHTVVPAPGGVDLPELYNVTLTASGKLFVGTALTTALSVVDETSAAADLAGATVTYSSSDPSIATVDDDGVVTGVSGGTATITVTVTKDSRTGTATASVTVSDTPKIATLEVRANLDSIGDIDTPRLVGILEDGSELVFTDVSFTSSDPEVAEVHADGSVEVKTEGSFTLKATSTEHYEDLADDFDNSAFEITPFFSDDFSGTSPFTAGTARTVQDGRMLVGTGGYSAVPKSTLLKDAPAGADQTDYVVKFTGSANVGGTNTLGYGITMLAHAGETQSTAAKGNYFYQLFSSQTLKRASGVTDVGTTPGVVARGAVVTVTGVNGAGADNEIILAIEGCRVMTYVNGKLVDTAHWSEDLCAPSGTIAVRNGSLDNTYYIDDLVVGTRALTALADYEISAVPVVTDKAALAEAVERAGALAEPDYTSSSWAGLSVALAAAAAVLDDATATQAEIDDATEALNSAIALLVSRGDPAVLEALVSAAGALNGKLSGFTDSSVEALADALAAAEDVLADAADTTQTGFDSAAAVLQEALAGLTAKPAASPDKTLLQQLYDAAAELSNTTGRYTTESWSELQTALGSAQAVLDDDAVSQPQLDAAVKDLNDAVLGLVIAPDPTVLQQVHDAAKVLSNADGTDTEA